MIPSQLPPREPHPPQVNPFAKVKGDLPKLGLAGNVANVKCTTKQHGISRQDYESLRHGIWDNCDISKLLWLWEEDSKYLHETVVYLIKENKNLCEIIRVVASSQCQTLKNALLLELLKNLQYALGNVRTTIFSSPGIDSNLLELLGQSEELTRHVVALMHSLGGALPRYILPMKMGSKTVQEHLAALRENPDDLRGKVLKALNVRPEGKITITEKQLGLILGDALIQDSGLEGHSFIDAMAIVASFREALGEELTRDLIEMRQYLIKLYKKDFPFDDMAKTLKERGRLAVPAGWTTSSGGHAMIADAVIEKNGTATVRLYNQGAGVHNHDAKIEPFRERRGAYLEKRDIPIAVVHSAAFWMILTGLKVPGNVDEPYNADDLYPWFIHCIPGTLVSAEDHILPQRSGSCAFKSILAYLKAKMSEDAYDRFILQFKFGILARYEEDLSFRKGAVDKSQRCFLQEIRHKLRYSVETAQKAGKISSELAQLLIQYCEVDIATSSDSSDLEIRQLTSRFKVSSTVDSQHFRLITKELKRTYRECSNPILIPESLFDVAYGWGDDAVADHKNMLKIHYVLRYITFRSVDGIAIDESFFNHMKKVIIWVKNHPVEIKGLPNQLILAWLTEFYLIAQEKKLSAQLGQPINLSVAPGQHPLECDESWLQGANLSALGEKLLSEWHGRRVLAKTAPRLFNYSILSNTLIFECAPAGEALAAKGVNPKYFAEFKTKRGSKYSRYFNKTASPFTAVIDVLKFAAEIELGITTRDENWGYNATKDVMFYKSPQKVETLYSKPANVVSKVSTCQPFVGIDLQLTEMEQDIEKIALFKPEESWFAIQLQPDGLGISPITTLIKQPNSEAMLLRITRFCERVLNDHSDREDLTASILTLVSEMNLRLPAEKALVLNLRQVEECPAYWRYLLSLPGGEKSMPGCKLLIHTNHVQTAEEVETNRPYLQRVWFQGINADEWQQARGDREVTKNGEPSKNGTVQYHLHEWFNSGFGSMFVKLFGQFEFGSWQQQPDTKRTERVWQCEETKCRIVQGEYCLFANGATLKRRLESIAVDLPTMDYSEDILYELSSPSRVEGIPKSLCKDHIEFWHNGDKGLIIDPEQRLVYAVDGDKKVSITNMATGAELLTGNVDYSQKLACSWKGATVRIPHFGATKDASQIPVEVWSKGKHAIWLNCMDGALRFFVSKGEYKSLDYPGFVWNPDKSVSELGMLNGVLLTNGREELFLLPEQELVFTQGEVKREKWLTVNAKNISVCKRTLHPDLAADDPNQRLFATANRSEYAYLIRELMLQRDWERALRYVHLIEPGSKEFKGLLTQPIWLQQPKADVLFLYIISKLGITPPDLEAKYLKYIDHYHHLEDGWALPSFREEALAEIIDPQKSNALIQNHLKRIESQPVNQISEDLKVSEMHSATSVAVKSVRPIYGTGVSEPRLIYRANGANFESLLEPSSIDRRLVQTAVCWFFLRKARGFQKQVALPIRLLLQESAQNGLAERGESIMMFLAQVLNNPIAAKSDEEIQTHLNKLIQSAPETPQAPLAPIALSKRQQLHNSDLARRVTTKADIVISIDTAIVGKTFAEQPLPQPIFSSLEPYLTVPDNFERELKRVLQQTERLHREQLEELKSLFTAHVGLPELFRWLETQTVQNLTADRLIRFAQTAGELAILRSIKMEQSPEQLRRLLNVASIVTTPMDFATRARLACFVWKRELALRPEQLRIITHTQNVHGLLAQADCGDGKTFAISPAISAISDGFVINVVPPGIFDEHARAVCMSFESCFGKLAFPLQIDRHDILARLEQIKTWMLDALRSRTPIVSTVADLSSIILAYHQDRLEKRDNRALKQIVNDLKKHCTLLLDEVDTAAKEQVHWTMGSLLRITLDRVEQFKELYQTLLDSDPDGTLFCLDGKKRFSRERYFKEGIQLLAKKFAPDEWTYEYLTVEYGSDKMQKEFEALSQERKDELEMLRAQLRVYLPHTLSMRYLVDYGPGSDDNPLVVPYKAANLADEKSRYTYIEIIANLTMQWMIRRSPNYEEIRYLIEQFLRAGSEKATFYAKRWIGPEATIRDLRAIVEKKGDWRVLVRKIQQNPLSRIDIAAISRLPKIELHSHVMQFTVATLESAVKRIIGLTATPYNHAGMDARLAENFLQTDACETTKACIRRCEVKTYKQIDEDTLSRIAASEGVHALMDPTARLVDYENKKVAEIILRGARRSIEQVVFWEPACGKWQAYGRRGYIEEYDPKKHKNSETFFHFDQARSRGMDMPLPDCCKAIVLVGHDCTFTALKQAMERCRLLKLGMQTVELWTDEPGDVVEHVMRNEKKQLREELPLMAKRKMFELCRMKFLEGDDNEGYKELFCQEVDHKSYRKHASLKAPLTVREDLEQYEHELCTRYESFLDDDTRSLIRDARIRCLKALEEEADAAHEPVLDMRAMAIHAKEQNQPEALDLKVQAQHIQKVYTEDPEAESRKAKLWDAAKVLPALATYDTSGDSIVIEDLKAKRVSDLFKRVGAPSTLFVSDRIVTHITEEKMTRDHYKRMQTAAYILQAGHAQLLLTEQEADNVQREFSKQKIANLTLHRLDGSNLNRSNLNEEGAPLPAAILEATAIFNGRLGPLRTITVSPASAPSQLAYLKERLAQFADSDPRNFTNNQLVQILNNKV